MRTRFIGFVLFSFLIVCINITSIYRAVSVFLFWSGTIIMYGFNLVYIMVGTKSARRGRSLLPLDSFVGYLGYSRHGHDT